MDQTPPRAFLDDEDVDFGKTPEPRRRRIEELERRGELLCREKGSLVVSWLERCMGRPVADNGSGSWMQRLNDLNRPSRQK